MATVWWHIIYIPHLWSAWGWGRVERWEHENRWWLVSPGGCRNSSGPCTVCAGLPLEVNLHKRKEQDSLWKTGTPAAKSFSLPVPHFHFQRKGYFSSCSINWSGRGQSDLIPCEWWKRPRVNRQNRQCSVEWWSMVIREQMTSVWLLTWSGFWNECSVETPQ